MGNKASLIEREIITVTGAKPRRAEETLTAYRARLIAAVDDLDDSEWNLLSSETQKYASLAISELLTGNDAPDFPDLVDVGTAVVAELPDSEIKKGPLKNRGGADLFRRAAVEAGLAKTKIDVKKVVRDINARGFKLSEATAQFTLAEVNKTLKLVKQLGKKEKSNAG